MLIYGGGEEVLDETTAKFFRGKHSDETHHLVADNKKMSPRNPHYIPNNIIIPSGAVIAFIHADPHHVAPCHLIGDCGDMIATG